jgi:RNA polymerase sigma-70 factor (ECF subfamily)
LADDADDEMLVTRAKRRDAGAFAALIRRYERSALAIAYAHLGDAVKAGDAVQEAFLKAWQKLAALDDPRRFAGWLGGITRNVAIDLRRRKSRPAEDREMGEAMDRRGESDPAAALDRDERRGQIEAALASLEQVSRSAVVLRYYDGLSSREIGELLGITAAAVDMRLNRARQQLRTLLAAIVSEDAAV